MTPYQDIIQKSDKVNSNWTNISSIDGPLEIIFPVPVAHYRSAQITSYPLTISSLSQYHFADNDLVIIDSGLWDVIKKLDSVNYIKLEPIEAETKALATADKLLDSLKNKNVKRIIGIGGGIVLNVVSYIAEQLKADLVLVPTSIVAMSDSSIGGKVRMNKIEGDVFIKHAYKSFYEPNQIIVDPVFLEKLSDEQIKIGMAEIIKHALYQAPALAEYLLSNDFNPFKDKKSLLKAILWTADLKRICLEVDPEESKDGSYIILRAAHDNSDKMEEASKFTLPHAEAVLRSMEDDLKNTQKISSLSQIYQKMGISLAK
jgi:3-dehydroquinate synthetase